MEHSGITRELGSRLKALRGAKGLSAAALGALVGVTENAIRKIESGDSKEPRFSTGLRIAHALGVRPEIILGDQAAGNHAFVETRSSSPDLASVIRQIRASREMLQNEGIDHVVVFGSVARGDATADSDVDVIVEPAPSARFSLFNLAGVTEILQRALGRRVDVLTRQMIAQSPLRKTAERDAVSAF